MEDIKGFVKRYLVALIIGAIALTAFILFATLRESKQEKLNAIYAEMQNKQDISKNAIHAKYQGQDIPEELIISAENEAVLITRQMPEYKSLESQATKLEIETPSPFISLGLALLIVIITAMETDLVQFVMTKIKFTRLEAVASGSKSVVTIFAVIGLINTLIVLFWK